MLDLVEILNLASHIIVYLYDLPSNVTVTDVTVNNCMVREDGWTQIFPFLFQVTMIESRTAAGFFKKQMRIEADPCIFK